SIIAAPLRLGSVLSLNRGIRSSSIRRSNARSCIVAGSRKSSTGKLPAVRFNGDDLICSSRIATGCVAGINAISLRASALLGDDPIALADKFRLLGSNDRGILRHRKLILRTAHEAMGEQRQHRAQTDQPPRAPPAGYHEDHKNQAKDQRKRYERPLQSAREHY